MAAKDNAKVRGAWHPKAGVLTRPQQRFAVALAKRTGLRPNVVGAWVRAESAGTPGQGYVTGPRKHNYLNIAITDSGTVHAGAKGSMYGTPEQAARTSARFIKGKIPGYRADSRIRAIPRKAAGKGAKEQLRIIARSPWASGHYGGGASLMSTLRQVRKGHQLPGPSYTARGGGAGKPAGKGKDKATTPATKPLPFGQQPILPGSSLTNKQLATSAQAAATTKYGPQQAEDTRALANTQQFGRDVGGFYQQYLAELAQHQQNVALYQAGAQQQLGQTAAGITGLSGQEGAALQAQANQAAQAQGTTQAGNLQGLASNAAATRQALMGSFQNQQALEGAAANVQASNLAHVTGPTQAMAGGARAQRKTAQARQDLVDLAAKKGAYKQQYTEEARQAESKNVTALQIAGVKAAGAVATTKAKTKAERGTMYTSGAFAGRSHAEVSAMTPVARQKIVKAFNKAEGGGGKGADTVYTTGAFAGKSHAEVAGMTPGRRRGIVDAYAAKKGGGGGGGSDTVYTSGAFAGMAKSKVSGMSEGQRRRIVDAYKKGGGGSSGKDQTSAQQGSAASQAAFLKGMANKAKTGRPFDPGHKPQRRMNRHQAAAKIQQAYPTIKDPLYLTAALDAAYDGHISQTTARHLRSAGISPSRIANALGVKVGGRHIRQMAGSGNITR